MSSYKKELVLNSKAITFFKNISYVLISNFTNILVSALVILIVPKLVGIVDYGYWQLYLFYSSYVGFLHFGWTDGIYLKYGGAEYRDLNKSLFYSQFWMLLIFQAFILVCIFSLCQIFVNSADKLFILNMTGICMLISNTRIMLIYILQGTNRIKEYAKCIISDRIIYFTLLSIFLLSGGRDYRLMIASDLIGKIFSLLYAIYLCNDIVLRKITDFSMNIKETCDNINTGIKLMFANIASMMIIGVVRFGIERTWDVTTFGKISLTLDVSNLFMVFINAVGLTLFPLLRRTEEDKLPQIYTTLRTTLMLILFGVLILYYPLRGILTVWLPQYSESLVYMILVFPVCIYEGKMSLLINTYLRTLRKEKLILFINFISVAISFITTFTAAIILKNLTLTVVSIVFLLAFRSILAEKYLSGILSISIGKDISLEIFMTVVFIVTGWFIGSWVGAATYLTMYGVYMIIKKREIVQAYKSMRSLAKGQNCTGDL